MPELGEDEGLILSLIQPWLRELQSQDGGGFWRLEGRARVASVRLADYRHFCACVEKNIGGYVFVLQPAVLTSLTRAINLSRRNRAPE